MVTARQYRGVVFSDRRTADTQGEKLYAGKGICRNGHDGALRYVSTGQCSECVRERNRENAQAQREARKPTADGARLFAYRLHPDDHAQALAFCQALDLQRGRMPQASSVVDGTAAAQVQRSAESGPIALPSMIAERRRQLLEAAERERGSSPHVPDELARYTEPKVN
jgi:hypothetical protein